MSRDMFVRTLGNQVTVYDKEGNIIDQNPPPPLVPPKVKYFDIVEFEDKLMGIDPNAKPDFFIDIETDPRFRDVSEDPEFQVPLKYMDFNNAVDLVYMILFLTLAFIVGFKIC